MKTSFKTLSLISFIPLLLLILPLHSQAEDEASVQTKDIQIHEGKEIINVSIEDIKDRLLNGEAVHFVKKLEDGKRTIKSEWITNALKKEYGVEKIDIKSAIITGDLDFHLKDYLVNIDECDLDADEIKKNKERYTEKVFVIPFNINIVNCQLKGNLRAGYDGLLKSFVLFKKPVYFCNSSVKISANFNWAMFNSDANFWNARFYGNAIFSDVVFNANASFKGTYFDSRARFVKTKFNGKTEFSQNYFGNEAVFEEASFNKKAYFWRSTFCSDALFGQASFNSGAYFYKPTFNSNTNFSSAIFKEKVDFSIARFIGKVVFKDANFNGDVNFNREPNGRKVTLFHCETQFENVHFNGEVQFGGIGFLGNVNFQKTSFNGNSHFVGCRFTRANFSSASFNGMVDFSSAVFNGIVDFSSARLENANLRNVKMRNAVLIDTNIKDAIISGVDLTGSQYEPNSTPYKGSLGGLKGLITVWFKEGQQSGLVQLRAALKESGLRDLEREVTYAIEHGKTTYAPWYEKWPKHLLFEWTCGYGLNSLRPLLILLILILVFSIPYIVSLSRKSEEGIWMEWVSKRMQEKVVKMDPSD